jgi:lipopolysaccharide transport system ATP-binding protein
MSSDNGPAILLERVGKCFPLYEKPSDRLRQFVMPRFATWFGRSPGRYYREHWALRDVSFQIERGEQVGIVGRNGAGKSTLLQIICNTLAPTTGRAEVKGRVAALLELGAGFNPQFTGRENVFLNGAVLGQSRAQIDRRFDEILAFADIGEFIDQPVKSYSSGMYMRLAFAIAVHVEPDVLVVDEALSVGDEAFQRKCHARIRKIRDDGATILFVSHSAGHVTEVCTRAILLDGGELLSIGSARQVVSRYQKLLYAPAGKSAGVRDALRAEAGNALEDLPSIEVSLPALATAPPGVEQEADDLADFDEGMVPQSTVVYPEIGCEIVDPAVFTPGGRRVNVLQHGREYVYCYRVRFRTAAVAVRFGMMVKTVSGVEVGGLVSAGEQSPHEFFSAGAVVEVRFRFRTSMTSSTYFLNAGVVGLVGDQEQYLARHVDVAMFRVASDPLSLATGMVDFGVSSDIRVVSDETRESRHG